LREVPEAVVDESNLGVSPDLTRTIDGITLVPERRKGEYWTQIQVGGQTISAVLDTGSSNLVIMGDTTLCPDCESTTKYTPSTDSVNLEEAFTVLYGSGQGLVHGYQDNVTLGCFGQSTPSNFGVFVSAQNLPNILGLAYPSLAFTAASTYTPIWDQIVAARPTSTLDFFAFLLCGTRGGSQVSFGAPILTIDRSTLQETAITHEHYYAVDAKELRVRGWYLDENSAWQPTDAETTTPIGLFPPAAPSAPTTIVDTGSTLNYIPLTMLNKLVPLLQAVATYHNIEVPSSFWETPAGSIATQVSLSDDELARFPDLEVVFTQYASTDLMAVTVRPETYMKESTTSKRFFGFRPTAGYVNILGQVFLENVYVEFDRNHKKLTFIDSLAYCGNSN